MADSLSPKPRSCYKCGFFAETADKICPNCGRQLHTTTATRIRGGLMAACGLVILGIIGPITFWMLNAMNNPTPGGARFNGNRREALAILGLFGMLITFGVGGTLLGLFQLAMGKRNRILSWAAVGFAVLIFVVGGIIVATFDRP